MADKAIKKFSEEVTMMGVCLVVLLLVSGCGPSLHQRSQACLASKDAQSTECADYWGTGQQKQAAALSAKDVPPPAPTLGYPSPGIQPRRSGR